MDQVREGDVLDGKYRVEHVLGKGGMGLVVSATHLQLGQRVALKLLLPEVCSRTDAVERFLREARAAVQIRSEHVARVSDVGTLRSGAPYMVMEYLQGSDLGDVVYKRGKLPVAEAVDYVLQACEALAEAHELGIVHRDLKLANLFLTQRPDRSAFVKVLDFGISKLMSGSVIGDSASSTASAVVMGSPQYMSPEQIMSTKDVDARTDIWSLGIILYEMLVGAPVFQAETPTAVLILISTVAPTPIRKIRPDIPPELERVILQCLQKNRTDRYPNVAALSRALRPFAPEHARALVDRIGRIQSVPEMALPDPTDPTMQAAVSAPVTGGPWGRTQQGTRRSRTSIFAAIGVLATGLVVLIVVLATRTPATATSPEPRVAAPIAPNVEAPADPPPTPKNALPAAASPPPQPTAAAAPLETSEPVRHEPAIPSAVPRALKAAPSAETHASHPAPKPKPMAPSTGGSPSRDLFNDPK